MSTMKTFLFLLMMISIAVIDCRSIRKRRQTQSYVVPQTENTNIFSYGYNTIRDGIVPAINSNLNRLSQGWDYYKQNLYQGVNQGVNLLNQGWNQLTQGTNRQYQYPYNNYNSYGYNQYGYNNQQYGYQPPPPPPPPNSYQNYGYQPNAYQNYGYGYQPNAYQNYGYGYNQGYYGRNMAGQQRYKRNIILSALNKK